MPRTTDVTGFPGRTQHPLRSRPTYSVPSTEYEVLATVVKFVAARSRSLRLIVQNFAAGFRRVGACSVLCLRQSLAASANVSAECLSRAVCVSCTAAKACCGVRAIATLAQPRR